MKQYFLSQLDFDLWANQKIISSLKNQKYPEECISLFSHIISAQDIWFERIKKTASFQIQLWDIYTIPECEILLVQSNKKWKNHLEKLTDGKFEELINYRNSQGKEFNESLKDILIHVLNHSSYHRAQINFLLSKSSLTPASIDYILYARR